MLKNDFTAESQSSQGKAYFIRIPEGGILIKIIRLINAMDIIAGMIVDLYFPRSQRKIQKQNIHCVLCVFRERSERAVNKSVSAMLRRDRNGNLIYRTIEVRLLLAVNKRKDEMKVLERAGGSGIWISL